jgi:putative ABC transport system permease protein
MTMGTLWRDAVHGWRMLRKNPGFSLIAILSIAIGVGANAAMFSVADGLILRPLPVPRPRELVMVTVSTPDGDRDERVSYRDYIDLRDRARSFEGLVAAEGVIASFGGRRGEPATTRYGNAVTSDFFEVLGVTPALGRAFRPDEDEVPGRDTVMVLAHDTWTEQFGADPNIVGRPVRLGTSDFTVIGVAPERFTGLDIYVPPAFYVPVAMLPQLDADPAVLERRDARRFDVVGRLKPGVSVAQADEEARLLGRNLAQAYPETNARHELLVRSEMDARLSEYAPAAGLGLMLLTLAIAVLLVACANVAGLIASRSPVRAREITVRLALGGGRVRLLRQLLTETALLAVAGGAAGLALAYLGILSFRQFQVPSDVGVRLNYQLDARAIVAALVVASLSAVLSSLLPAWRATRRVDLSGTLRATTPQLSSMRLWGRHGLVAAQVGLSLLLLMVAVAFFRAFEAEYGRGTGFRTERMALMTLDPSLARYDTERTEAFYERLSERVAALPGVTAVGLTSYVPFSQSGDTAAFVPEGFVLPEGREALSSLTARIDAGYLETMGVALEQGRAFTTRDTASAPRVAIVNRGMADRYWPGGGAIGKRIRLEAPTPGFVEIVGIARDAKQRVFLERSADFIYLPRAQHPMGLATLVVATSGESAALAAPLRAVVQQIDGDVPIRAVRTIEDYYHASARNLNTVTVRTIAGMGSMGLVLAMVGLYGFVAFAVGSRTREIGLRMAVGAASGDVLRMILRQGAVPTIAGVLGGLAASAGAFQLIAAVFPGAYGDWSTYAVIVPALALVVMAAAYIPARRAARIDPITALRQD